jgi:hypothetical protein
MTLSGQVYGRETQRVGNVASPLAYVRLEGGCSHGNGGSYTVSGTCGPGLDRTRWSGIVARSQHVDMPDSDGLRVGSMECGWLAQPRRAL